MLNRRGLITGLIAFTATAPAIVRAASLMPVKQVLWDLETTEPIFGLTFISFDAVPIPLRVIPFSLVESCAGFSTLIRCDGRG